MQSDQIYKESNKEIEITQDPKDNDQNQKEIVTTQDTAENHYSSIDVLAAENKSTEVIQNMEEINKKLCLTKNDQHLNLENKNSAIRVSVIKRVGPIVSKALVNGEENATYIMQEQSNHNKEDFVDIEQILDICFSECFDKTEDSKYADQKIHQTILEKRHRKSSTSVLPFKKRRTVHQFVFLSTAIIKDQTLIPAFTFEEEFRLHDLEVRRDSMNEETLKFMLQKSPMIMNTSFETLAESFDKKKKIPENQFSLLMNCWHTFGNVFIMFSKHYPLLFLVSSTCREAFEEFKNINEQIAFRYETRGGGEKHESHGKPKCSLYFRCIHYSMPANFCLWLGINDCNKHLSLHQQTQLTGQNGGIFSEDLRLSQIFGEPSSSLPRKDLEAIPAQY